MSRKKEMPPELMAKFFQGVQENPDENMNEWKSEVELRPPKLGLGAKVTYKKKATATKQEQRIKGMIKKEQKVDDESDSSSSDEGTRARLGTKHKK